MNLLERSSRRVVRRYITSPIVLRNYINYPGVKKLNLGAGNLAIDGWLNADIRSKNFGVIFLDAGKRFPFKDCSFDYILSEHTVEHLSSGEMEHMLFECRRVLKPAGGIRITTPDLGKMVGLYNGGEPEREYSRWVSEFSSGNFSSVSCDPSVFAINNVFYNWGHKFIYDFETLKRCLVNSGFVDVKRCRYGESSEEAFNNVEVHHISVKNREMTYFETLAVEARK